MKHRKCVVVLVVALVSFSASCSSEKGSIGKHDFERLCEIYGEVTDNPVDLNLMESRVVTRVQNELPLLFKKHFIHVIDVDMSERYRMIEKIADYELGGENGWECHVMQDYFSGKFDTQSNQ